MQNAGACGACDTNPNDFEREIVPADGTRAAIGRSEDFGTSPFLQVTDKLLACLQLSKWRLERKIQWEPRNKRWRLQFFRELACCIKLLSL